MGGTISIPKRESTVIYPTIALVYLFVGTVIGSVYVAVDGRCNHRVVEGGVEIYFVVFVITFYCNLTELAVPVGFSLCQIFVEVIFGYFSL